MIKKNLTSSIILVMMLLITPCVSAQTYRQIKGWSKEVNDRLEDFLNSTITMKILKVAVFDGDGTVMGQVPHYLADEALYQYADEHFKGKTDKFSKEKMAILNRMVKDGNNVGKPYVEDRVHFLAGLTPEEILEMGYACYQTSYRNKFYPEMKQLIANLKEYGFEVWILTASPEFLYQKFLAEELGIPEVNILGVKSVVVDGKLTDDIILPIPQDDGKANVIPTFIKTRPLVVGGNSRGDMDMLNQSCGLKIVVNPDDKTVRGKEDGPMNGYTVIGGALIGPMAAVGMAWFGSWQAGTFWFPAIVALVIVVIAYLLIRDTPQSCGLPPIEQYRNDYPPNYSAQSEVELTAKEIFFKYVLSNKILWYIAIANAFIYLVRYGVLDWAPTYLKEVKGYDIKEIGWAYFSYEFAAIPGTIFCGWLSDKVFKGRRAITTMIYMVAVAIFVFVYWEFSKTPLMDSICLIAIGFLIYGPVMLIGVHALDLAPKKAAGTAAGFTGFFGYFFGTALFANIGLGYVVQNLGWNWNFIVLLVACALAFIFIGFTAKEEQYLVKQAKQ